MEVKTNKTYKREVSVILMSIVVSLAVGGVWYPGALAAVELLVAPIFLFSMGAFGLDAYSKQIGSRDVD